MNSLATASLSLLIATCFAPRLEVNTIIVSLKYTVSPLESVNLPSSKICKNKLKPVIRGIEEKYKLELEFEKEMEAIEYILKSVDSSKGGRDILNAINDRLLDPLAMFLFENKDDLRSLKGSKLVTKLGKNGFEFSFDE